MAFALVLAGPAAAGSQDARQVEIGYEITFAGISGFRIDLTARLNGPRYDVEANTFKDGMLRAVTMHYYGRNRAWGSFSPSGANPTAGSLSIIVSDKTRTWLAKYGAGGRVEETHDPPWKPAPSKVIPDSDRVGSLDPLTAALMVGFGGDAACDRTLPINDGKRRTNVILRKIGVESAAASGIANAQGDVLVCEIFTKRVSGEFDDAPKEAETERERPIRIWLARFDQSQIRYPGRMEAQTGFGTIRGKLLWFRERPLTPG
jgi:hypothetical protein